MDELTPFEKFREFLLTKGERLTRERERVVQIVFSQRGPFLIEQLIDKLAANGNEVRISRATVYRAVKLLEEAGLLRKSQRLSDDYYEVFCG